MTNLGLIGAGNIGGTLARLAVAAGDVVFISNSRGPETLAELAGELGPRARAVTPAEAAASGDLVVVTVPLRAYGSLPVAALAGKVVIDTGNYYPARDGQIAELESGSMTSGELLQARLPGARVVKCFNNIFFRHLQALARPAGSPERSALPIAGDDPAAKATVTGFLNEIGYDAADAGPLSASRKFQPGTPLYGVVYAGGNEDFAASPGVPASSELIRGLLASA